MVLSKHIFFFSFFFLSKSSKFRETPYNFVQISPACGRDFRLPMSALRVVEWVALIRFLFGMWHYQSTLDFAFLF